MADQDNPSTPAPIRESSAKRSTGIKQEFKMAEVVPHPVPGSTEFLPQSSLNRIEEGKKKGMIFGGAEGEVQAKEKEEAEKQDDSNIISDK